MCSDWYMIDKNDPITKGYSQHFIIWDNKIFSACAEFLPCFKKQGAEFPHGGGSGVSQNIHHCHTIFFDFFVLILLCFRWKVNKCLMIATLSSTCSNNVLPISWVFHISKLYMFLVFCLDAYVWERRERLEMSFLGGGLESLLDMCFWCVCVCVCVCVCANLGIWERCGQLIRQA